MESNILKCLALGLVPGTFSPIDQDMETNPLGYECYKIEKLRSKPSSISVRTISTMGENVLQELTEMDGSYYSKVKGMMVHNFADPYNNDDLLENQENFEQKLMKINDVGDTRCFSNCNNTCEEEEMYDRNKDELFYRDDDKKYEKKNIMKSVLGPRRNTSNDIDKEGIISSYDTESTIKCVCAVYRAQIIQSSKEKNEKECSNKFENNDIFNDANNLIRKKSFITQMNDAIKLISRDFSFDHDVSDKIEEEPRVPTMKEITYFYRNVFFSSEMESDCIIMSLIYIEKLMKATNNAVRPTLDNWRSLLLISMIIASKVWDDLSMWNIDFTEACPEGITFSLKRVNELEMTVLNCLNFDLNVSTGEYAKYYFLIRSISIQRTLHRKDF